MQMIVNKAENSKTMYIYVQGDLIYMEMKAKQLFCRYKSIKIFNCNRQLYSPLTQRLRVIPLQKELNPSLKTYKWLMILPAKADVSFSKKVGIA